jgi:hypothetical protein
MPEHASSVKVKVLRTVYAESFVTSFTVILNWVKKF